MLSKNRTFKKTPFNKIRKQQGFAVLTTAVLLSLAGIIFTTNMASSQLVDNQIIGNYYRNNEAFANAESGINFVLSQLDDDILIEALLTSLPYSHSEPTHHYTVEVNKIHSSKLEIISYGTSVDTTARRQIQLQIDFYNSFPIPDTPIGANGKLNFSKFNLGDPNCKGLDPRDCLTNGNTAEKVIESNPSLVGKMEGNCAGIVNDPNDPNDPFNKNSIDLSGISYEGNDSASDDKYVVDNGGNWQSNIKSGSEIFGVNAIFFKGATSPDPTPNSLFEATYGIEFNEANIAKIKQYAVEIDGAFCADQLQDIGDEEDVIFITGDCIIGIGAVGVEQSSGSENKLFTIGSVDHPKLVFIEGGTIKVGNDNANAGAKVVGMLHMLPGTTHDLVDDEGELIDWDGNRLAEGEDPLQQDDLLSINMGGITVDGALLSEYKCTYSGSTVENQDERSNGQTNVKEHFSATYDKTILGALYSQMGLGSDGSRYKLSSGTWRDF
ncbi:pilus assembly PilX N-terminal domain-containing protein [Psychromonas hadalis]|uniref:pilus assembly PilX N-terminal domain-containing protein n=1 Tax=Psychromonas hadalis TaxID=211669 RepID=UPI0003B4B76B|nr:pilus assembly PilX N-terminal domain-containing protein [Psychromonas hadalis]